MLGIVTIWEGYKAIEGYLTGFQVCYNRFGKGSEWIHKEIKLTLLVICTCIKDCYKFRRNI